MKKTLNSIFDICFLAVSLMIFAAAFSQMILQSVAAGLLVIPLAFLFVYICIKKTDILEKIGCEKIWWVLRILSFFLMMKIAFSLEVEFSWDWGRLINSSYNFITAHDIKNPYYYARYPNNQFWLLCMVSLFKIIKLFVGSADILVFKHITMAASVIILQIAIEFIYRTAKMIFSPKAALLTGILSVSCLPLYLYSEFLYTDTPSVLLISVMLFLYFKFLQAENRKKQIAICVLLGLVGALTYFIKIMAFIVFAAILIGVIFTKISFKRFLCFFLVCVTVFGVSVKAIKIVTEPIYKEKFGITDELKEKYEFPPTHWIMMGLGYGGFSQDDVNYTAGFDTYQERKNATVAEIKRRCADYGFSGLVKHIFYNKVIRTFGNCTLAGSDYAGRRPIYKNGTFSRLLSEHGDLYPISLVFLWIYYIFIMLGLLFSAIGSLGKKKSTANSKLLAGRIAIFGIFAFMLLWECNSRYLLVFIPVMILLSVDGLSHFVNIFKNHLKSKAK